MRRRMSRQPRWLGPLFGMSFLGLAGLALTALWAHGAPGPAVKASPNTLAAPQGTASVQSDSYRVGRLVSKAGEVVVEIAGITDADEKQIQRGLDRLGERGANSLLKLNDPAVPARFRSTAPVWLLTTAGSFKAQPKGARLFTGGSVGLNLILTLPTELKAATDDGALVVLGSKQPVGKLRLPTRATGPLADTLLTALRNTVPAEIKSRLSLPALTIWTGKFPAPHAYLACIREPGESVMHGPVTGLLLVDARGSVSGQAVAVAPRETDYAARYLLDIDGDGTDEVWLNGEENENRMDWLLVWKTGQPVLKLLYTFGAN